MKISQMRTLREFLIDQNIVKAAHLVVDEIEIARIAKNSTEYPISVIVIPSRDGENYNEDNIRHKSQMLIYFLSQMSALEKTEDSVLQNLEQTEAPLDIFIAEMKKSVEQESHKLYNLINQLPPTWHIDPEYDFHGLDGWSISFELR